MQRRTFVSSLVGLLGSTALGAGQEESKPTGAPDLSVKRVLVMFKCHFDAGFVDTQAAIVRRYFDEFFPKAIKMSEDLRRAGAERYVWTTGSWLLYEYLEQAETQGRRRMEAAI